MIIGYDAKRAFANHTGLGNYSRTLLTNLAKFYPLSTYKLFTPPYKKNSRNACLLDAPFEIVQPATQNKIQSALWRSFGQIEPIKQNKIQVFHGLSNELPAGLQHANIPAVVSIHDLIFERYPTYYPWIDRQFYRYKFKKAALLANKVVAISQQTANDLIDFYKVPPARIQVIYQTADIIFEKRATELEISFVKARYKLPPTFVLYVGTVNDRKNLACLIEALRALPQEIQLVVVGTGGAYYKKMRLLAQQWQLSNRILWLGAADFQDFPALYAAASVFALPSYFEGFGIPVVEALWSGTPALLSEGHCFEETAGEAGFYLPPQHAEAWASKIVTVIEDSALKLQHAALGLKHVQTHFSRANSCKQWIDCYQELHSHKSNN